MFRLFPTYFRENLKKGFLINRKLCNVIYPRTERIAHFSTPISSASKIKKIIKYSKGFEDLQSCMRTKCPICPPKFENLKFEGDIKQTNTNDIYVNKSTGK